MKILAIRGKNLASLEGEFDIDFTEEPLSSSGIFAITGQTGAGKSTILDALCLALFDNAPRLNKAEASVNVYDVDDKTITQKDSRNILRRGAAEGYAEVDFIALNGDKYRSRWSVRRARGKADGALQATSIKLDNLTTNSEGQGTKSNLLTQIVEAIGLTFDQFTRAVLLAQGDFANFLKAKSSEKAELLEKLTGTEIYSKISVSIYQNTVEAKQSLDLILQRMKDVKLLSEEEHSSLTQEKQLQSNELIPLKNITNVIGKKLDWIQQKEQFEKDVLQAQTELAQIQDVVKISSYRYEYMNMVEKSLEIRDYYLDLENRKSKQTVLLTDVSVGDEQLKVFGQHMKAADDVLFIAVNNLKKNENDYNCLKSDFSKAKDLDSKIKFSADKAIEIKNDLDVLRSKSNDYECVISELRKLNTAARQNKIDLVKWFLDHDNYSIIISKIDLITNLIDSANTDHKLKKDSEISLSNSRALLVTHCEQLANLEVENERLNMLLPSEIMNLRQRLVEGEACVVCGSKYHPFRENIEQQQKIKEDELEASKTKVLSAITKLKEQIDQSNKAITEYETYTKNFDLQFNNSYAALKELLAPISDWESKFKTNSLVKELLEVSTLWNENKKKQEANTLTLENSSVKIEAEEKTRSVILESIEQKEKVYRATIELHDQEKEQRKQILGGKSVEEVENYYLKQIELQSKKVEEHKLAKDKIAVASSALQGKLEQQRKEIKANEEELIRLEAKIKEWLDDKTHQISAELLKELIARPREWINQEKEYLSDLKNKELSIRAILTERQTRSLKHLESDNKLESEETKENLESRQLLVSEQIELISKRLSEVDLLLLAHDQACEQIKLFEKELKNKTELHENWSKLNDLLGSANGNKFKTIAQGYTLDVLLSYANKHLEELTQRYSLQKISDTLALQVVDNDMLGEVRSVHSLSGGESFLISLALALGLSSLSSNRMKIESLFIDEGFGALDIDTLSIAMDALDNLQTQGRKIGVVSHVEEMKERITTQIQVLKSANGRSSVRVIG